MTTTAYDRLLDALRDHGSTVNENGHGKATAQCPAHNDGRPSLSVTRIEGSALLYCHAGCQAPDVLGAVGLTPRDLFDDPQGARYGYPDGRTVLRTPDKRFTQRGNTKGRALFHADRIGDAQLVYVVEGEKDVLAVEAASGVAVCPAMGAGKAKQFDWSPLSGRRVIIVADRDEPGRKHATTVAELLDGKATAVQIVASKIGKDVADHLAAGESLVDLVPVEQTPQIVMATTRLADVQPERVSWLWPGRIPVGKLVTLDGDPGLGKSTLALDITATITTAGTWPDGSICGYPGAVLLMSAEDGLADTVRPRLDAAGADVTKVHAVDGVPVDADGTLRPPTLADVLALEEAIHRTGARLLVIDVVMAYLPDGTDSHKDQDIRRVLSRLAALADRTGCTVLLLRHLNKAKGGDPLYRGGGSIGIVGAARAGLLVAPDPDDPERRVLASVKSNLGPAPESLAYRLVGEGEFGVARVQWEGQTGHTARSLLSEPAVGDGDNAAIDRWLTEFLKDGRQKATDVYAAADASGYSKDKAKRAKKALGVDAVRDGAAGAWFWVLPSRTPQQGSDPSAATPVSSPLLPCSLAGHNTHTDPLATQGSKGASDREVGLPPASPPSPPSDTAPGGLTEHTPGLTPRVQQIAARNNGRFAADPPCYHCDKPVTGKQTDTQGRYAHINCQREEEEAK